MAIQHILFKKEATSGTWTAPARAYPMENFTFTPGQEYTDLETLGYGFALQDSWRGAFAPSGSFEYRAYEEWLGTLFQLAGFNTATPTVEAGGTLAYGHGLIPQESAATLTGSVQGIYSASIAHSFRGLAIDKLTFSCKAKEPAMIKGDWIAKDTGYTGGNWFGDGTAAPAVVASPTYFGATVGLLHFAGATLTIGGTPALSTTTNQFSLTGGSVATTVDMCELTIANNYLYSHTLGTVYNPSVFTRQKRTVEGKLDIDWSTISQTHYASLLAGTEQALTLQFQGSLIEATNYYKLIITLPKITIRAADIPPLTGAQDRKIQSVGFKAQIHPTMVDSGGQAYDIGVKIIDKETAY